MRRSHVTFLIAGLAAIIFLFSLIKSQLANLSYRSIGRIGNEQKPSVKINNAKVFVDLAQTPEQKSKGLSGRANLAENAGMLFVFNNTTNIGFWMKDMLIPLDIIWINDAKIVYIHENVLPPEANTPDAILKLYTAPVAIDYVLEVNAGFTERYDIEAGDSIDLSSIN